jgi:hypothetical protein
LRRSAGTAREVEQQPDRGSPGPGHVFQDQHQPTSPAIASSVAANGRTAAGALRRLAEGCSSRPRRAARSGITPRCHFARKRVGLTKCPQTIDQRLVRDEALPVGLRRTAQRRARDRARRRTRIRGGLTDSRSPVTSTSCRESAPVAHHAAQGASPTRGRPPVRSCSGENRGQLPWLLVPSGTGAHGGSGSRCLPRSAASAWWQARGDAELRARRSARLTCHDAPSWTAPADGPASRAPSSNGSSAARLRARARPWRDRRRRRQRRRAPGASPFFWRDMSRREYRPRRVRPAARRGAQPARELRGQLVNSRHPPHLIADQARSPIASRAGPR